MNDKSVGVMVITGASDGLGREIAKLYKQSGYAVANVSRRACPEAEYNFIHDLTQGSEIQEAAQEILALDVSVKAIINCAGVYNEQGFGDITESEIKRVMATNVKAPLLLASLLIDRIKQDRSDVLSVVSTAGTKGKKEYPLYAASKWATRGVTASLQEALKDTPCRVISFCPGGIRTHFSEKALGYDASEADWMQPQDVAHFVKQILDLPKNMEVTEVILNRKRVAS